MEPLRAVLNRFKGTWLTLSAVECRVLAPVLLEVVGTLMDIPRQTDAVPIVSSVNALRLCSDLKLLQTWRTRRTFSFLFGSRIVENAASPLEKKTHKDNGLKKPGSLFLRCDSPYGREIVDPVYLRVLKIGALVLQVWSLHSKKSA